MSKIWNSDSTIEENEGYPIVSIDQLPAITSMMEVVKVVTKLYYKQPIDDSDFITVMHFLDEGLKEKYPKRYDSLVKYATEEFKRGYTIRKLKQLNLIGIDDKFINSLYDGILSERQQIIAYTLLSENNHFLEDELIDDKVRQTLRRYMTDEFISKMVSIFDSSIRNPLFGKSLMSNDLKNEIINSIPNDYTKLEQCIYIYIKLCQILSYDSSYFVNPKQFANVHEDFLNVKSINANNSGVVCYEFVTIYSELLESIGILSKVNTQFYYSFGKNDEEVLDSFRDHHASLDYHVDNFIISADSTNSVLSGDFINVKLGNKLNGLKCMNVKDEDVHIFESSLAKVYRMFIRSDSFKKYTEDIISLPFKDRLKNLFNDISNINVQSVDFISYINSLKHTYFTEDELRWNIVINYVGKYDGNNQYPVAIFSVNPNDILYFQQDTTHYLYDTKEHLLYIYDNQELRDLFESELFMLDNTQAIPGVISKKSHSL